jgi:hypothetical protein
MATFQQSEWFFDDLVRDSVISSATKSREHLALHCPPDHDGFWRRAEPGRQELVQQIQLIAHHAGRQLLPG